MVARLSATERYLPYGIMQFYLPLCYPLHVNAPCLNPRKTGRRRAHIYLKFYADTLCWPDVFRDCAKMPWYCVTIERVSVAMCICNVNCKIARFMVRFMSDGELVSIGRCRSCYLSRRFMLTRCIHPF